MVFSDVAVEFISRGAGVPAVFAHVGVRAGKVDVLHVLEQVVPAVLHHAAEQAAMARPVRHPFNVGVQRFSLP